MNIPLTTTFRDFEKTPAILAYIKNRIHKLSLVARRLTDINVIMEKQQKRNNGPSTYHVRVTLNAPGLELTAVQSQAPNLYKGIHMAFNKLQRQLHDHNHIMSGMTKHHETLEEGRICRLFPNSQDRFGFIEAADGEEFYFSPTNLASSQFDHLKEGDSVRFIAQITDRGPQAHHVKFKHHKRSGGTK